jgi:hypothetical protein
MAIIIKEEAVVIKEEAIIISKDYSIIKYIENKNRIRKSLL